MSLKEPTFEGEALCARQAITFISARVHDRNIYVKATSRDQYGELWVIRFNNQDEHVLSERLIRFSLDSDIDVPFCIINDVAGLREYMRDRDQRGLGTDPVDYDG